VTFCCADGSCPTSPPEGNCMTSGGGGP
jgi:hypothetical protein